MNKNNFDNDFAEYISSLLNISITDFFSNSRKSKNTLSRQLFCYFSKRIDNQRTLDSIGKFLKKDHSTVIHSIKKVEDFIYSNAVIENYNIRELISIIESSNFLNNKALIKEGSEIILNKARVSWI